MSEVRSWDGMSGDIHFCADGWKKDIPVRVVAWPEGAPKQEDVPQVGEKVRKGSNTYTVVTGIPYKSRDGEWYLLLLSTIGSTV